MRDSIIFYRSFYEAIRELPPDIQSQVYTAIFEFSMNFEEIELQGLAKTIFTLIKPQLEANNKRFANGKKPKQQPSKTDIGIKQTESKTEAKPKQNQSKSEANNNNNVLNNNNNVNNNENENEECTDIVSAENEFSSTQKKTKSFEERKEAFKKLIDPFREKYESEMLNDFWRYWTETNPNGKKMRFEMQKVFDVGRRLGTWKRNDEQKFKSNGKSNSESRQQRVNEVAELGRLAKAIISGSS